MKILFQSLLTALFVSAQIHAANKPNIIFILCDDLGYGDIGVFYQNQRAAQHDRSVPFFSTPYIDTLARDGVKLTQHYSGAPVCAPSRASLLSGLTQGNCNVRDNQFDKGLADSHTLGSVLKQAGYATAAIGKWGLQGGGEGPPSKADGSSDAAKLEAWTAYPTKRGFDYYFGYVRHKDGHFHYPKEDGREVWENDHRVTENLDKCYTTDLWTARAKKWITDQTAESPKQPFFVYLAFDTPHAKLVNPPCPYPKGGGLSGGVQWTGKSGAMLNTATGTVDGYMFPDYATATWDNDHHSATPEVPWPDVQKRYANNVRRIDFAVGDVLQLLKDLKIDDHTLVVFTSDNGPSIESYIEGEPYAPTFFQGFGPFDGIKRDVWEGGVREPTLVRWPQVLPAGRVDSHPSGQWDWMNTFAEIAEVAPLAASDGVSLVPSLTGRGFQKPTTLYIEYKEGGRTPSFDAFTPAHRGRKRGQMQAIYLDGYKGVRYNIKSPDDDFEIYKVTNDARESRNLAKSPELAKLQTAMKARVLQVRTANSSAPRPYDHLPVPANSPEPATRQGLSWSLYPGSWPWMPDFRDLTPRQTGEARSIDLSMTSDSQLFGMAFTGYFLAANEAEYTFSVESDTAAMLILHDIRVIDEPTLKASGKRSGSVRLKAGWHPMRLYYRHFGDDQKHLVVTYKRDGTDESLKLDESNLRMAPATK